MRQPYENPLQTRKIHQSKIYSRIGRFIDNKPGERDKRDHFPASIPKTLSKLAREPAWATSMAADPNK